MAAPPVDDDVVRRLAHLARIQIRDEALGALRDDLVRILEHVETLRRADRGAGSAPGAAAPVRERPDEPRAGGPAREDLMRAVARVRDGHVVAPDLGRGGEGGG